MDTLEINTQLRDGLTALRGNLQVVPDASIIIPVNAQADLTTVQAVLGDLIAYRGTLQFEVILVINNYPAEQPPTAIDTYTQMGAQVVSAANLRQPGRRVAISARVFGARAAISQHTIHVDADCRVPNARALLDWYVAQLRGGAVAAYTHVDLFDLSNDLTTRARVFAHHASRWYKRVVMRIPTIRGSNFAINRDTLVTLFDSGYLPADFSIGPICKVRQLPVRYSGARGHTVLTSGRYFERGWRELVRYLIYRLRYNKRMLEVRADGANPDEHFVNNKPYAVFLDTGLPGSDTSHSDAPTSLARK